RRSRATARARRRGRSCGGAGRSERKPRPVNVNVNVPVPVNVRVLRAARVRVRARARSRLRGVLTGPRRVFTRAMVRRSFACFVVAVSLAGAATGCENEEPKTALNYTADAKRAYEAAMVEFDDHNWLEAQNKMREIKRKYSYSKYARLAELRIADADYAQE